MARRKSYYVKKRVLPVRDAILLHLLDYHGVQWPGNMPIGVSQEGVSEAVAGHRGHVSRILRELIQEGLVYQDVGRVETLPTVVKTYHLTEDGARDAVGIREEVRTTRAKVVGEGEPVPLADLERRYEGRARLLEVALHTVRRSFDPAEFEKWMAGRERFVDRTKRMPVLRRFFGRAEELDAMGEWFADECATTLVLKGIPGIGKTALAARFVEERKGLAHTFWYAVDGRSGLPGLLKALAGFDAAIGNHGLAARVQAERRLRVPESLCLLERELKGRKALLVIDDVHKASERVRQVIAGLIRTMPRCAGPKLILVGREIPKLYDRRRAGDGKHAREMVLDGLDATAAAQFLEAKEVAETSIPAIVEATKGHPLLLQLCERDSYPAPGDFGQFLEKEVFEGLSKGEARVLAAASVYRTPVFGHGLLADEGVSISDVASLTERGLLVEVANGRYELHDLVRQFARDAVTEEDRIRHHRAAAEYYRPLGDPDSTAEAIHHLMEAREGESAIDLAVARGRELLTEGATVELVSLLDRLLDLGPEEEDLAELLLVRAKASYHMGERDDAIGAYQRVLDVADSVGNEYKAAEALRQMGLIYLERSEHEVANDLLMTSLKVSRKVKDLHGLAETYYEFGKLYSRMGPYSKAKRYWDMSLKWAERSGDTTAIGKALFATGSLERTSGKDLQKALELEMQALELFEEDGAVYHMARACHGIGHCLEDLGRGNEAIVSYRRSQELYGKAGDVAGEGYVMRSLAGFLISKEQVHEVEPMLGEALQIFSSLGDQREVAFVHLNYAGLHGVLGQHDQALKHLARSLEGFESLGEWVDLASALAYRGRLLSYMGRPEEASAALDEALAASAKVNNMRVRGRIVRQIRKMEGGKGLLDFKSLVMA